MNERDLKLLLNKFEASAIDFANAGSQGPIECEAIEQEHANLKAKVFERLSKHIDKSKSKSKSKAIKDMAPGTMFLMGSTRCMKVNYKSYPLCAIAAINPSTTHISLITGYLNFAELLPTDKFEIIREA